MSHDLVHKGITALMEHRFHTSFLVHLEPTTIGHGEQGSKIVSVALQDFIVQFKECHCPIQCVLLATSVGVMQHLPRPAREKTLTSALWDITVQKELENPTTVH